MYYCLNKFLNNFRIYFKSATKWKVFHLHSQYKKLWLNEDSLSQRFALFLVGDPMENYSASRPRISKHGSFDYLFGTMSASLRCRKTSYLAGGCVIWEQRSKWLLWGPIALFICLRRSHSRRNRLMTKISCYNSLHNDFLYLIQQKYKVLLHAIGRT